MAGALALAVAACAVAPATREPAPADAYAGAIEALDAGNVALAAQRAERGATDSSADGRHLLLLRAWLALDPRNPARQPERGATLAVRYIAGARDRADAALGMFLYAVALDLGAPPDASAGLPRLPARPLADRLQELERAVARLRSELARIQETLKP
jgi:hypothetical protein